MIKIALAGVGGYGIRHVKGFSTLEKEGRLQVVAVADPSPSALDFARSFFPGVRCYKVFDALLDRENVDAVVLTTPIPLHEEMTLKTIQKGFFVLLEKPAVPLVSQWHRLMLAELHERVAVAFQRISSPQVQTVRSLIDAGALGQVRSLATWGVWPRSTSYYKRAPWAGTVEYESRPVLDGPNTNGFAHLLNDIMFLGGDSPNSFGIPAEIAGEVYRARPIPSYDTACVRGTLRNGIRFFAGFSHASSKENRFRMRVEGSKGTIWIEEDGKLNSDEISIPEFPISDGCMEMRRAFVDFVSGHKAAPDVSLDNVQGYTLAANLMFQSSGGIHPIPPEYVCPIYDKHGDEYFEIREIGDHLGRAAEKLCSLSELAVPWARPTPWVAAEEFSERAMLAALRLNPARNSSLARLSGTKTAEEPAC